jgi:NRAMP (natural resistance-associated macrophage protein)-like metal ion transporter
MGRNAAPITPPEPKGEVLGGMADTATEASARQAAPGTAAPRRGSPLHRLTRFTSGRRGPWLMLASLGPGLIAANAGNDAGGIATYASVGAKYGYDLLWMFPLILISLAVVQEMAARMGAATGKGLSDLIRENFSIHVTGFVLLALLIANGGTVITEFIGIAASIDLVLPGAQYVALPLIALAIWLAVVKGNYSSVERVFLAMTLVFFAYPISAVLAHPDWGEAARHTVVPTFHFNSTYLLLFVATVGTSITPYMQVYVQSTVADKGITARDYRAERIEVYAGSLFANLIAVFIVIATAATLFPHHEAVQSAQDAARALGPIAGSYAKYLFAVGLFGASMLAAAVLPLATAYSIAEAMGVEKGVSRGFREAPVFMGLFTGLIVLGVVVALIPGLPVIQVLVAVQAVDCLLLPVVLFAILKLINQRRLMGEMVNGPIYNLIARVTAVIVTVLSFVLLGTTILQLAGANVG